MSQLLQNWHILTKKSKITYFDGQRAVIFEAMGDVNHFGT